MRIGRQGSQLISNRQLLLITLVSRLTMVTAALPVVTCAASTRDAWIAALLATGMAAIYALLIASTAAWMGNRSIAEYAPAILGKVAGRIVVAGLCAFFLWIGYLRMQLYTDLISITVLPNTPAWAVVLVGILPPSLIAWKGLDGLGRAAEIVAVLFLGSLMIALPLAVAPELQMRWLLPVLEEGLASIIPGIEVSLFWFTVSTLPILAIYPHLHEKKGHTRAMVLATILAGLALTAFAVLAVAEFGPAEANHQLSPVYALVKNLNLGRTVRRLEILTFMFWTPALSLDTGLTLWAIGRLVAGLTGLQIRHASLLAAVPLAVAVAWPAPDIFTIRRWIGVGFAWPLLAVPLGMVAIIGSAGYIHKTRKAARRRANR